jgi:hypothetical protein
MSRAFLAQNGIGARPRSGRGNDPAPPLLEVVYHPSRTDRRGHREQQMVRFYRFLRRGYWRVMNAIDDWLDIQEKR